MYERFYGLSEHPFSLTPDPDFFFLNGNFRKSLDQIIYALDRRETFSVLIGDVGTGKTTLCRALLSRMPGNVRTALILNPLVEFDDLLRIIIQDFQIRPGNRPPARQTRVSPEREGLQDASWLDALTQKQLIDELNRFLLEGAVDDIRSLLIIDEAQNLSAECLEHLRVLSNLETSKRKLLQIVFSGQLELDQRLDLPELRQLKQRITVRCSLQPLSERDMDRYTRHRLRKAGGSQSPSFSKGALKIIYSHSHGYPRLINMICDRALMEGYAERSQSITGKIAKAAVEKMAIGKTKTGSRPFPFPVKAVAAAIAVLLAIGGTATYFRARIRDAVSAAFHETIKPASGNEETASAEIEKVLQNQPDTQAQVPASSYTPPPPAPSFSLQVHSLGTRESADRAVVRLEVRAVKAGLQRCNTWQCNTLT